MIASNPEFQRDLAGTIDGELELLNSLEEYQLEGC